VVHSGFRVHGLGGAQAIPEVLHLAFMSEYFHSKRYMLNDISFTPVYISGLFRNIYTKHG
jgi:hypothetical protein